MVKFLLRRFAFALAVLLIASFAVFFLIRAIPGDPVEIMLGSNFTQELYEKTMKDMGFDKPVIVQYGIYLQNTLKGDFGTSISYKQPTAALLGNRFKASLELAIFAMIISMIVSIPLGVLASVKKGSIMDIGAMTFAILGNAMTPVWTGMLLILIFGVMLRWLPVTGYGSIKNMLLPAVTMGFGMSANVVRHLRSSMYSTLQEDHTSATRARGVPRILIYCKYALRHALLPVVTLAGVNFANMLAGSAVVETVFGWPGLGNLLITSITNRDYPVVQSCLMMSTTVFVIANLLIDILYSVIDPRARLS